MWRSVHSIIGLAATAFVVVLSLSGAFLATQPVYDAMAAPDGGRDLSLAETLRHIHSANPDIIADHLKRDAAGTLKLGYVLNGRRGEAPFDAETGALLPAKNEPQAYVWTRHLHRGFLLGDEGRVLSAIGGIAMAVLTVSGIALLVRRAGGWRHLLTPMNAEDAGGLHAVMGRLALVPLLITALTALYLSAQSFSLFPTARVAPAYPESVQEMDPVLPWDLVGLQQMPLAEVNEVIFPIVEDWFDVWAVRTDSAYVFYDQFTGAELSRDPLPLSARVMDVIRMLHTGEGAPLWAIVLLLANLSVPAFAVTGAIVWWTGRKGSGGRIRNNAALGRAEALILVGSEGGATWGFAAALHKGLHDAGVPVRTLAMNKLPARITAQYVFALTSTYGDGDAPKNADRFLGALETCDIGAARYAVLGFGDKSFPRYCAFAGQVAGAMETRFGGQLVQATNVDRKSAQTFEHWCALVAEAMGKPLSVTYEAPRHKTTRLTLSARKIYGEAFQAPVAVLRFQSDRLPRHTAGDLVSICPPDSKVARLYSLGSCARGDGFMEICVRRQDGGKCSGWLCGLDIGQQIDVAITRNPRFHMPRKGPVVMISAGTGIAPFAGMIRNNARLQPIDLFWGGRHPKGDALYQLEIADWQKRGLLHRFVPAWSRVHPSRYVQDMVQTHRDHLIARLKDGATIMV